MSNCGLIAGAFSSTSGKADTVLTTKGDLATYSTTRIREAVGTNNYTLMADSAQATGIKWAASATSVLTTAGDLLVASGANTLSNPTTEASNVGQTGAMIFIQPSSGSAGTVSLGTDYETVGGSGLTLSSTNSAYDVVPYIIKADNSILLGTPQLAFS